MQTGWKAIRGEASQIAQQGSIFLKLSAKGDWVKCIFLGDPIEYKTHWVDNTSVPCTGDGCALCADKERSAVSSRVMANVYDMDNKTVRVLCGSKAMIQALGDAANDYDMTAWVFKVVRVDIGKKTAFEVKVLQPLPPEKYKELITDNVLHDLATLAAPRGSSSMDADLDRAYARSSEVVQSDDDGMPF
jgi:hypothetical protein